jgi:hypothetical protein
MATEPTIVTSFYNIRKMENNPHCESRGEDTYLQLANRFILQLPYPLVIFIDDTEDADPLYEYIQKHRPYPEKTFIYRESFQKTYFFSYVDRIAELRESYIIQNRNYHHESPYYIVLNNNKFHFLEKAIEKNVFQSTHFLWLDFGINHVAQNPEIIYDWILQIPDKIKQMCLNPYLENDDVKHFFRFIYHHTSGGLFSGSMENMKKYVQLFKEKVQQMYQDDWYQIDEAIMTMIQRENPDLFEFYYGDYQGIISNYQKPYHNLYLIFYGLRKTMNYQRYDFTKKILDYLEPYFEEENHRHGEFYHQYLRTHLALYSSDLKESVIQMIKQQLDKNCNDTKVILEEYSLFSLFE